MTNKNPVTEKSPKPKTLKVMSTAKLLGQKYGGKWKHVHGQWECDDGNRYVCRVATGMDFNGEYTGAWSMCLYHRDGKPSEWVGLSSPLRLR